MTIAAPTTQRGLRDFVRDAGLPLSVESALVGWLAWSLKGDRHAKLDGTPHDPRHRIQLAQAHRAELLRPFYDAFDEATRATLDDVFAHATAEPWPAPSIVRLPFLVPLGSLARWNALRPAGSARLVEFLSESIRETGVALTTEQLEALLRTAPWLLVLDGLDEVPASAGRREVLALVDRMQRDVEGSNGLLVGTTRPQGYQGDFGPVDELRLAEFTVAPSAWSEEFALPRPSPPEPMGLSSVAPERIDALHIQNLRAFEDLTLPLDAPASDDGTWIVLLGENGTGKSTLLRAVTLALADPNDASAMFTESAMRAPYRRVGTRDAIVSCVIGAQSWSATIESGENHREALRSASDPSNGAARARPFLVAYGCRRGTATGGRDQKVVVDRLDDIGTLFDAPGRALVIAESWLKDLELAKLKNEPGRAHIFDVVREALVGDAVDEGILPGVRSMEIAESVVWFEGPDIGRAPLAALSDGYITTTGWVIDLMARWVERRRERKEPVARYFTREMVGFVLIDEIDLHLHPRWQRQLIPAVRKVFPKLSFIVTTHNPLTVIGARRGEVFALRREKATSRVSAVPVGIPVGLSADQVLTGEWFGLATTLDPETFELWEKHYRALREGVKAGDPSLRELEQELARRLGTYSSTSVDRIALEVAAKVMGDVPEELTPEERATARDRILAGVNAELAKPT